MFKKAIEAYKQHQLFGKNIQNWKENKEYEDMMQKDSGFVSLNDNTKFEQAVEFTTTAVDNRYNTPKEKHKASDEQIDHVLATTPIYQRANKRLNKGQRGQIGYGIDKYPEPLNADTWTIFETLDHIMDESIDKMHYEEMLREKFELLIEELDELRLFKEAVESEQHRELHKMPTIYTDTHIYPGNVGKHHGYIHNGMWYPYTEQKEETDIPPEHREYYRTHMSGADHDGDSTYIKECKAVTISSLEEKLELQTAEVEKLKIRIKEQDMELTLERAKNIRSIAIQMINAIEQEQLNRQWNGGKLS